MSETSVLYKISLINEIKKINEIKEKFCFPPYKKVTNATPKKRDSLPRPPPLPSTIKNKLKTNTDTPPQYTQIFFLVSFLENPCFLLKYKGETEISKLSLINEINQVKDKSKINDTKLINLINCDIIILWNKRRKTPNSRKKSIKPKRKEKIK